MPLMPKRVKYRKNQRGRIKGQATRGNTVSYGEYGLQALHPGWINSKHIESSRVSTAHFLRGEGKLYIRIFPHKPITSTPQETRMGKGKGEPFEYVACVKPGTILFELGGVTLPIAKQAFNRIARKLPIRVRLVERRPR